MHSALTTETPDFFLNESIIGLSLYRCTVPYRTVRYGTVRYKVTNMSRGRFSIGDKGQSFLFISQTHVLYRTLLNLSSRFPVRYGTVQYMVCFIRPVVVFHYYIWNNQVFYYGTIQYSIVLYRTVG